ncbi:hypothetical protein H310_11024 [Aphanomyces invadans]|uniref:Uncharacterized protein n=1 Tax=Aphanomyces invadans TaxID=157072 RepID=A0A024TNK4_9STRA|nr:hypothetical protein H310_11024 [Aphanomyces invadans]ETV95589.1 hypothetical protein H310_11024 [Aphanomyces invadans]|eukprot:XP_008875782.1 hypothetical protein H310_11024 [Aphanomyces invadans]
MKRTTIARLFHQLLSTISNWIERYESTSSYDRKKTAAIARFSDEQKRWIVEFYCVNPNIFLDKCKKEFEIDWPHHNVQFLDGVSFDYRGMLRKRGYAMKG